MLPDQEKYGMDQVSSAKGTVHYPVLVERNNNNSGLGPSAKNKQFSSQNKEQALRAGDDHIWAWPEPGRRQAGTASRSSLTVQ